MPTVTGLTAARLIELEDATVIGGHIDVSGHLILEQHDGGEIDAGDALVAVPSASETTEGAIELATQAEVNTGTDAVRAVTPATLAGASTTLVPAASDTVAGRVELATSAETITGSDATRAVTPAGLQAKVSSDTALGIVELATSAETITGTDTTRAVTPAGLAAASTTLVPAASDTVAGRVELATSAETITGTDATRAVTPAGLAAKVASTTAQGIVELATDAETVTGTDTTRAVTPTGVWAAIASGIGTERLDINPASAGDNSLVITVAAEANGRLYVDGNGSHEWGPGGGSGPDTRLYRSAASSLATDDDFLLNVAGKGVRIKEGSNARMGISTLVGGTVVVSNTSITANTRIFLTCNVPGGTPGFLRVSSRSNGTSFTILSSSGSDTSQVAWFLMEPA